METSSDKTKELKEEGWQKSQEKKKARKVRKVKPRERCPKKED